MELVDISKLLTIFTTNIMKKIDNKPLTEFSKLPIKIAEEKHYDLTQTNLTPEEQQEFVKNLLQEIGNMKDTEGVILAHSKDEKSHVMAKLTSTKSKNNTLIFPEPNPVTIYYNTAVGHVENTINIQKQITSQNWVPHELYPVFIDFFSESFQAITQLTMTLEALFNQKIPEEISLKHGEKSLSKQDIEWQKFKEKYRNILPHITGIDIYKDHNRDYQNIIKLNILRNDLIHLKSIRLENFTFYQTLFKELMDFDYEKHATSVLNIINILE
jgi:hypothetical protein